MADTILKDIGTIKQRILTPLLDSEDIRDLIIIGGECSDDMWYGEDDDDDGIVYEQIFPYLYMDETQTEVKAYVCFDVDVPRIPTATIKDMTLVVWCICHKSAMKCHKKDFLGTRADMLADAVERALRDFEKTSIEKGKGAYGIGQLHLDSVTRLASINKEYYGRQLLFTVPDFKMKGR